MTSIRTAGLLLAAALFAPATFAQGTASAPDQAAPKAAKAAPKAAKAAKPETRKVAAQLPGKHLPGTPAKVTEVEGITEYRLANGLRVLLFPDQSQAHHHGERHLPRRQPPRELRRDRHGAPARAPDVQGHAEAPRHRPRSSTSAACASTAPPGWTAPTTTSCSRPATTNLAWAIEMEADRMVNSFIARKDLDSEMTVVRNEYEKRRELALPGAAEAPAERRLRLAQLRQLDHRQPQRHREREDREPAGVLSHSTTSPTTRCCWWPASSMRRRRSRSSAKHFGAIPKPDAQACRRCGRSSPRRTASAVHRAPQGRHAGRDRRLQGALEPARRFRRRSASRSYVLGRHARPGACTRRWWKRARPRRSSLSR